MVVAGRGGQLGTDGYRGVEDLFVGAIHELPLLGVQRPSIFAHPDMGKAGCASKGLWIHLW